MSWLFLTVAILSEVGGTLSLRMAAHGRRRWYAAVALGYLVAFTMLSFALDAGIPLGVAYGIWAAVGVALTAVISKPLFKEPLTPTMMAGIGLIIIGVLAIEISTGH